MFGTIRRHQTWLWLIIATVTILSMLVYFGKGRGAGGGQGQAAGDLGQINGRGITAAEYSDSLKEFRMRAFFTSQRWPERDSVAVKREAYLRLFLISQLKQLGIDPGEKAVAEFSQHIMGSMSVDDFVAKFLKPENLTANDFERFLRHELGIEQLISTTGLSGQMVTPQQAEALYRSNHRELTTALVYFSATNFVAGVSVTPEALTQFYTTNMNLRYHLRDRVQVDYVKFDSSNYLAAAAATFTNLDKNVDEVYRQYGTNLFPGMTNEVEIKLKVKQDVLKQRAMIEARRAAGDFADELDKLTNKRSGDMARLAAAATNKLTVLTTQPFDDDGPKDTNFSEAFTQTAFQLTTNEPFGGPVTNSDASFVLEFKRRIPSEIEPLDQIKDRVIADFREAQAMQLALQAAEKFRTALTNGLALSNRFEAICAAAQVRPETMPPFSLSSTNLPSEIEGRVSLGLLQRVAFSTPVGAPSRVVNMPDGGFILYVEKQSPADETKVKKELPQFLAYLRQTRQSEAFNQWFSQRVSQDPQFAQKIEELYNQLQGQGMGSRRSP